MTSSVILYLISFTSLSSPDRSYFPILVLLNSLRYPPTPSLSPKSFAIDLMYVPLLLDILNINSDSDTFLISNSETTIFLDFLSISLPALANLYKGLPLCLIAENIGGICSTSPRNVLRTDSISSSVTFTLSIISSSLLSVSKLFVLAPILNTPSYSLSYSINSFIFLSSYPNI